MLTSLYESMVSFFQPKGILVMLLLKIVEVFDEKFDTGEIPM